MALTEEQRRKLMEKAAAKQAQASSNNTSPSVKRVSADDGSGSEGRHKIQPKQSASSGDMKKPILFGAIGGAVLLLIVFVLWHPWSPKTEQPPVSSAPIASTEIDHSDEDLPSANQSGQIVNNANKGEETGEASTGESAESSTPGNVSESDPAAPLLEHKNPYAGDSSEVSVTLGKEFAPFVSQSDADTYAQNVGYKAATLNEDGSITFVMTKEQYGAEIVSLMNGLDDCTASYSIWKEMTYVDNVEISEDYLTYKVMMLDVSDKDQLAAIKNDLLERATGYAIWIGKTANDISITFYDVDGNLVEVPNGNFVEESNSTPVEEPTN